MLAVNLIINFTAISLQIYDKKQHVSLEEKKNVFNV